MHGLSAMVQALQLVGFADWRWHTLAKDMRHLNPMIRSIAAHFDPLPFRRKLKAKMKLVCEALTSEFLLWFQFVGWFMCYMDELQLCGGICMCHQQEYELGKVSPHLYKTTDQVVLLLVC